MTKREEKKIERILANYNDDPHLWEYDISDVADYLSILWEAYNKLKKEVIDEAGQRKPN